jgi:hypothetical protein
VDLVETSFTDPKGGVMAEVIQEILLLPPIAIARLGGSTSPQDAYTWVSAPNPRSRGETTITPDWSLSVRPDATVDPVMAESIAFRDGPLIRPVCPFLELWALTGEAGSDRSTWKEIPVTPNLLRENGAALSDVMFTVDARNFKASRRTGNAELQYGTFPPLRITADNQGATPILATSPPGVPAARRMIPANQRIPLGSVQVMKSRPQPLPTATLPWTQLVDGQPVVNVEVVRVRFTPARGHAYGPPDAAQPHDPGNGPMLAPVDANRAFLNASAGWAGADASATAPDPPQDTYDGADVGNTLSLGVIDDTCEARISASLSLPSPTRTLIAAANVFVGPPDFAPDRRPFLSLADELNDRTSDSAARSALLSASERDAWVEDLFERIYETLSLLNVDVWRRGKGIILSGTRLAETPIPGDQTTESRKAMSGTDALRNRSFALPAPSSNIRLPLTEHARSRHRTLSDLDALRDFIAQNHGRLAALIRRPFEAERTEDPGGIGRTTMRMPPFMRNSNAGPLTLTGWQYELLMSWVQAVETLAVPAVRATARPPASRMSEPATRRRDQVLARVARSRHPGPAGGSS